MTMLSLLAAFAAGVLLILQCWLIARSINAVLIDHLPLSAVLHWLWPLLAVLILRAGCEILRQGLGFEAAARIKTQLRDDLSLRIARLGAGWIEGQQSGAIASRVSDGVEAVERYFAAYLPQKIIAAFLPVAILVAVFPTDWVSGIILGLTLPILPLFMIIVGKGAEQLSQSQWRRLSRMGAHFFDVIRGLVTLRQFGAAAREARVIGALAEDYRLATMKVLRVAFLSSLVLEFFATISVAMVAVYIGFRLYYGALEFLPGFFALLLAPEFFRPLRDMGSEYHARMDAIGAVEDFAPILDAPLPETGGDPAPAAPRRIVFEDVSFAYPGGQGVSEASFALEAGKCLALCGPSGAGKTTLAKLALGIERPQSGRILVDGQDLSAIDPASWRRCLGWMPQRATLFAGTIADNIRLSRPEATEAEIRRAATLAQASGFIEARPLGYETQLGDGGRGLSGGQRQRIAVARMILSAAPVLILDEPTASLDLATGHAMVAALRAACPAAAILMITHDVRLAQVADEVIVLEHGHVVEAGSPADLATTTGSFAELLSLAGESCHA